jgi:hypothetical protein
MASTEGSLELAQDLRAQVFDRAVGHVSSGVAMSATSMLTGDFLDVDVSATP